VQAADGVGHGKGRGPCFDRVGGAKKKKRSAIPHRPSTMGGRPFGSSMGWRKKAGVRRKKGGFLLYPMHGKGPICAHPRLKCWGGEKAVFRATKNKKGHSPAKSACEEEIRVQPRELRERGGESASQGHRQFKRKKDQKSWKENLPPAAGGLVSCREGGPEGEKGASSSLRPQRKKRALITSFGKEEREKGERNTLSARVAATA